MFSKKTDYIEKSFEILKKNFLKVTEKNSLVQFVSSNEKINKASLILNLARSLSKDNYKVIIVEADFRDPELGELCDIDFDRGFFEKLENVNCQIAGIITTDN